MHKLRVAVICSRVESVSKTTELVLVYKTVNCNCAIVIVGSVEGTDACSEASKIIDGYAIG